MRTNGTACHAMATQLEGGFVSGESVPPGLGLSTGRRRESVVWDYFVYDVDEGKSVCQVELASGAGSDATRKCGTKIAGKFPTNMKAHIKGSHPVAYEEMLKKEAEKLKEKETKRKLASPPSHVGGLACGQRTLLDTIQHARPYDKESPRYIGITRKLATFVAAGNVANRVVECEEFRELFAQLDPRYPMPSRAALDREMEALLIDMKGKVAAKLQDTRKVAICTDIWSRKGMTQSFLGITAHFFTKSDHRRCVATLAVRVLPSPHTADRIEELVRNVLQEWDIPIGKISAILTDNGSNMIAAFKEWVHSRGGGSEEEEEDSSQSPDASPSGETSDDADSEEDPDTFDQTSTSSDATKEMEDFDQQELEHDIAFSDQKRLGCFSHTLQLVVHKFDTMQSSKRALQSARRIVKKFSKSVKANEKLISRCGLKLISDCPTRWNSTHAMISRLLAVRPHLTEVLHELEIDNLPNSEWKVLENYRDLLEPFMKYTALIGAEEYTTLSMVVPILMELKYHLNEVKALNFLVHGMQVTNLY